MPSKKPYLALVIEPNLLQQITDYQFNNRFANRTQAVLDLICRGLEDVKREKSPARENKKAPHNRGDSCL